MTYVSITFFVLAQVSGFLNGISDARVQYLAGDVRSKVGNARLLLKQVHRKPKTSNGTEQWRMNPIPAKWWQGTSVSTKK